MSVCQMIRTQEKKETFFLLLQINFCEPCDRRQNENIEENRSRNICTGRNNECVHLSRCFTNWFFLLLPHLHEAHRTPYTSNERNMNASRGAYYSYFYRAHHSLCLRFDVWIEIWERYVCVEAARTKLQCIGGNGRKLGFFLFVEMKIDFRFRSTEFCLRSSPIGSCSLCYLFREKVQSISQSNRIHGFQYMRF